MRYLYHGSQYLLEKLIPRNDRDGQEQAVFATESVDIATLFALPIRPYPDTQDGRKAWTLTTDDAGVLFVHVECGIIDPYGVGYVYTLSSEGFTKINELEWISHDEVKPIEVMQIKVDEYWHRIRFSAQALEINKALYPSDSLYQYFNNPL